MNLEIKGIHYNVSDTTREFFDKKLEKIAFAEKYIQDLTITVNKEHVGQGYKLEAKIHFSWGLVKMLTTEFNERSEVLELLIDKVDSTVRKEKGKIQEH